MKKATIITTAFILLTLFSLQSCGNLTLRETADLSSNSAQNNSGIITGTCAANGARTAFPSFSPASYEGYATTGSSSTHCGTFFFNATHTSFTIKNLDSSKTYDITITAKDESGNVILEGKATSVSASGNTPVNIILSPVNSGKGNISLVIKNMLTDPEDLFIDESNLLLVYSAGNYSDEIGCSNGEFQIEIENIDAGTYFFELCFYELVGSERIPLYFSREAVNVFGNLTTDTWVKPVLSGQLADFSDIHLVNTGDSIEYQLNSLCVEAFQSQSLFVDKNATGSGTGSWNNPCTSLQAALVLSERMSHGSTLIYIKSTTASPHIETISSPVTLSNNVDIYTLNGSSSTPATIRTDGNRAFFITDHAEVSFTNIHFSGNSSKTSTGNGGFISADSSASVMISGCTFENGKVEGSGGAIYNNGEISISNCSFSNNFQDENSANAVYCAAASILYIDYLETFAENQTIELERGTGNTGNATISMASDILPSSKYPLYLEYIDSFTGSSSPFIGNNKTKANNYFFLYGHNNYEINSSGNIIELDPTEYYVDSNASVGGNGMRATPFRTIREALEARLSSSQTTVTIYVADGSEEDTDWSSTISINKNTYIKAYKDDPETADDDPGSATIYLINTNDRFNVSREFYCSGIIFDGRKSSDRLNACFDISEYCTVPPTFDHCSFININPAGNCGCMAIRSSTILKDCTFHNENISVTGQAFGICKQGSVTLKGRISIASQEFIEIFGDASDTSLYGKIILDSSFEPENAPWKIILSSVATGSHILTAPDYSTAVNCFTISDSFIDNNGCLQTGTQPFNIYVDPEYEEEDSDGTINKPYTTLYDAISWVNDSDETTIAILLTSGKTVTESTPCTINSGKTVIISSTSGTATICMDCDNILITSNATLTISNIVFNFTTAIQNEFTGLLKTMKPTTITNCSFNHDLDFNNNDVSPANSLIQCSDTLSMSGCIFSNIMINGNGGAINSSKDTTISSTAFSGCWSTSGYGGAIYFSGGTLTLNDCEFHSCQAQRGGPIYVPASGTENKNTTIINGCTFTGCLGGSPLKQHIGSFGDNLTVKGAFSTTNSPRIQLLENACITISSDFSAPIIPLYFDTSNDSTNYCGRCPFDESSASRASSFFEVSTYHSRTLSDNGVIPD